MPNQSRKTEMSHSQDVMLCEQVSQHPCLYDLKNPKYRDTLFRDRIWEEIGAQLKQAGEMCKNRWRNIRDSHQRNKRERKLGTGSHASAKPRKWVLLDHLAFLEAVQQETHCLEG
ncbi:uncharacterized protein LOC126473476 isoform X2 [Schistocerca serialis cubense]|uniref:uncharacterized protein LOC126473476 isoform X2 n=1 Tax=Schistocerca serialis cubense TaxID=2023355 RepID=UPI00214F13E3|nr:uncharacterized protein LOC126473476 isoform X2 [Schistocerca serialis cubense]